MQRTKGKSKGSLVLLQENQSEALVILTSYLIYRSHSLRERLATTGLCIVIIQGHKALIHNSHIVQGWKALMIRSPSSVADVALSIGESSGTPRRSLVEASGSSPPFTQWVRGSGFFRFSNQSSWHSELKKRWVVKVVTGRADCDSPSHAHPCPSKDVTPTRLRLELERNSRCFIKHKSLLDPYHQSRPAQSMTLKSNWNKSPISMIT